VKDRYEERARVIAIESAKKAAEMSTSDAVPSGGDSRSLSPHPASHSIVSGTHVIMYCLCTTFSQVRLITIPDKSFYKEMQARDLQWRLQREVSLNVKITVECYMTVCHMTWFKVKVKVMEVQKLQNGRFQSLAPLPVCM